MLDLTRQSGGISRMPDKSGGHMIFNDPELGWRGAGGRNSRACGLESLGRILEERLREPTKPA
jgi:hypothetical protein